MKKSLMTLAVVFGSIAVVSAQNTRAAEPAADVKPVAVEVKPVVEVKPAEAVTAKPAEVKTVTPAKTANKEVQPRTATKRTTTKETAVKGKAAKPDDVQAPFKPVTPAKEN